ncbi:MAG: hypothetical protein H3C43_01545 [Leptonema sp. (in: Bacteria)]|nr:hypothetical protein [Leptonema sp. (in: bacteria)]
MRNYICVLRTLALVGVILTSVGCGQIKADSSANSSQQEKDNQTIDNSISTIDRAIDIVQKQSGVYFYRYAETIDSIDPRTDYTVKYRIFRESIISDLRNLVASNKEYQPEFKAKCLPVYDVGLEFKDESETAMFLFSYRCNTIRYVEGNQFKDFTPQRTAFYKIFEYEINDDSATIIDKK